MTITAAGMLKILLVTVIWRIVGSPFSHGRGPFLDGDGCKIHNVRRNKYKIDPVLKFCLFI